MPCRVDPPYPTECNQCPKMKRDLDHVTHLLCKVMEQAASHYPEDGEDTYQDSLVKIVTGLGTWWREHLEADRKRKEALRKSAAAKLTPEEREALGLK